MVDADRGVKLEVEFFYRGSNLEVLLDRLHSLKSILGWYSLSEEWIFFSQLNSKGQLKFGRKNYQQTPYVVIRLDLGRAWELLSLVTLHHLIASNELACNTQLLQRSYFIEEYTKNSTARVWDCDYHERKM